MMPFPSFASKGDGMSTISSLSSSNVAVYTPTTSQVNGATDPDGDGDSGRVHHGHHGGGHGGGAVAQQLLAALKSLGLTVPNASSSNSSSSDSKSTDATSTSSLRKDIHEFMHQLFHAARQAESSSTSASGDAGGKHGFSQGLAAVLSEVSSGNTPSGLQSAFDHLKSDLTASGGASSSSVTLQALLTKLQSNIGYGGTPATGAASGVAVNTVA